jgi:5-methylcytosine-specific restriction endonuclease McrA
MTKIRWPEDRIREARLDAEASALRAKQKSILTAARAEINAANADHQEFCPTWKLLADFNALEATCQRAGLPTQPATSTKQPRSKPHKRVKLTKRPKPGKGKSPKSVAKIVQPPQPYHDGRSSQRPLAYSDYLRTQHWSSVRTKAVKRADHKCQQCGAKGHLNVHHLTYAHLWFEYPDDLRVLCETCHAITHGAFIYAG